VEESPGNDITHLGRVKHKRLRRDTVAIQFSPEMVENFRKLAAALHEGLDAKGATVLPKLVDEFASGQPREVNAALLGDIWQIAWEGHEAYKGIRQPRYQQQEIAAKVARAWDAIADSLEHDEHAVTVTTLPKRRDR